MLDRIRQLMESKGLSASQFADAMEVPRAVVSHVLSGRNKPSLDVVLKIASTYTDVNLEWLLLGNGDMLTTLVAKPEETPSEKLPLDSPQPTVAYRPEELSEIKKVQDQGLPEPSANQDQSSARVVIQVMMFYSDGTFETFKPAG